VSLKSLHNSNKNLLQISTSTMPVFEASLTLSFLYQYHMSVVASQRLVTSGSSVIRFMFLI